MGNETSADQRRLAPRTPSQLTARDTSDPHRPLTSQASDVIHLQRLIGNRATNALIRKDTVQRDPEETWEGVKSGSDKVLEAGGLLGSIEYVKPKDSTDTAKKTASDANAQNAAIAGVAVSSPALVMNVINTGVQGAKAERIRKERSGLSSKTGTEHAVLTQDYHKATKATVDSTAQSVGNIYSIVSNSLIIAKTVAEGTATVLGVIGAGIGAAFSLLSIIRDSVNIHKRNKRKKKVAEVVVSYQAREQALTTEVAGKQQQVQTLQTANQGLTQQIQDKTDDIDDVQNELDSEQTSLDTMDTQVQDEQLEKQRVENTVHMLPRLPNLNPRERRHDISTFNKKLRALNRTVKDRDKQKAKVEKIQARLTALQNEVTQLTQNVQDNDDQAKDLKTESDQLLETVKSYKERGVALGVVDRKLGNALKGVNIAGSIVGLIGSGVGIAGLILAGTAAAAVLGPVGWAIGGLLLAVGVGVLIGTAVKKKIRANNVKRMRSEKGLIETFIATGKVNGAVPSQYPAADTKSVDDRKALQWQRAAFPTTPSKKASKSDPNQTMEARLNYITEYLGKYDVEAAGDAIWYGVLDAFHGTEGQQDVPNPKHTEWENLSEAKRKKKPEPPKNIKLKTQISNLINDLDPKNANKIIADINTVGKQWYEGQQKDPQEDLTDQGEIKRFNAAKRLVLKKLKVG